jgi:hypothetical protein
MHIQTTTLMDNESMRRLTLQNTAAGLTAIL